MTSKVTQIDITVPLSGTISSPFGYSNARAVGILGPEVTSCAAFLQVAMDTTSASFARLHTAVGSGDWTWFIGPGPRAVSIETVAAGFPYARLELSAAQAAVRSFAVLAKY